MSYTNQADFDHGRLMKTGVLITNLGTPEAPTAKALRPWLREFLSDPRVVEIPRPLWWLILNGIVLLTRPARSAKAYRSIWMEQGSPLAVHTRHQFEALQRQLRGRHGEQVELQYAFRYGRPSIAQGIQALMDAGAGRLLLLPLYPQYSASTGGSSFDALAADLCKRRRVPDLRVITHYHDHPGYIALLADSIRSHQQLHGVPEQLVMSFHGLPQRYLEQGDPYYCECRKTARLLAEHLGLQPDQYVVAFQSRFGAAQWLQPYTGATLRELAEGGARFVQVVCPGFSVDCLETLEEIAIAGRRLFLDAGGEVFQYIPALNADDAHISFLADLVTENLQGWLQQQQQPEEQGTRQQRARDKGARR